MRITVLGSLSLNDADFDMTPSAPKQREMLGILLLRTNKVVSFDAIIHELWEVGPPADAVATVHAHMAQLRRVLHQRGLTDRLQTRENGYSFRCEPDELDLDRALHHIRLGEGARLAGRVRESVDRFEAALSMWPAPVLFDVDGGPVSASIRADLQQRRLRALRAQINARLRLGEHQQLLGDLRALVHTHPTDEHLHAQLMTALYRCGRQVEALAVYTGLRNRLADHHGAVPSAETDRLHASILSAKVEHVATADAGGLSLDLAGHGAATRS
jgi:DNA-binding SARP family transcriptional activator